MEGIQREFRWGLGGGWLGLFNKVNRAREEELELRTLRTPRDSTRALTA